MADFKTRFTALVSLFTSDPRSISGGTDRWGCIYSGRDSSGISTGLVARCWERAGFAAERDPFPVGIGEGGGTVAIRGREG